MRKINRVKRRMNSVVGRINRVGRRIELGEGWIESGKR